jgi:serine/threonine protein kinase
MSNHEVYSKELSTKTVEYSKQNQEPLKYLLQVDDYILFESTIDQSNNTAVHNKTQQVFLWKRFERSTYMKKLEAYFLLSQSEYVYKYEHLLHKDQFVYVFYSPYFGDLHSYMKEKKKLDELEAKFIFKQCVQAVLDCHENGIILRDIKLKKFVFLNEERTKLAIANIEDSLILDNETGSDFINSQQGCPAYVSPEVLNSSQTSFSGCLSDSWSLGIVLFTLLFGSYPFYHEKIAIMFAKIIRGKFQLPSITSSTSNGASETLSLDAKILLRSLIRVNPNERLLPQEILAHNWLRKSEHEIVSFRLRKEIIFNQLKSKKINKSSGPGAIYSSSSNEMINSIKLMKKNVKSSSECFENLPKPKRIKLARFTSLNDQSVPASLL